MHKIVVVSGVTFEFPNGREVFHKISFSLGRGVTALVGPNGAGKTTLAKLLAGELEPTRGTIRSEGPVAFFSQREVPQPITVNMHLGPAFFNSPLSERLLRGIDRELLCTALSGGEWMRVRLARTLSDRFLILDEPTNDLDREGRDAVLHFLRERAGGALLISHDRECLELCDEVLELSNRGLMKFGGGWTAYESAKAAERERLGHALNVAKRERDEVSALREAQKTRQEKRNRQGTAVAARGGMPKILLGARKRQAQETSGRIDAETLARKNEAVSEAHAAYSELKLDPVMYADLLGSDLPKQKLVAEARGFNVKFKNWVYREDLNFNWRGSIRLALRGPNGCGKSTLLRAIMGEELPARGEIRMGGLKTLYIDQRCSVLDDTQSVLENMRDATHLTETEIRNGLARFLFTKDLVFQKVAELSGGERLRATLARGLLSQEKPELLVLDEPTNNLDLGNIEFLENLVRQFRGALIVISHDEVFLKNCGVSEELNL